MPPAISVARDDQNVLVDNENAGHLVLSSARSLVIRIFQPSGSLMSGAGPSVTTPRIRQFFTCSLVSGNFPPAGLRCLACDVKAIRSPAASLLTAFMASALFRSEERRVGKEWVSTF